MREQIGKSRLYCFLSAVEALCEVGYKGGAFWILKAPFPDMCLHAGSDNAQHWWVATQDKALRHQLEKVR